MGPRGAVARWTVRLGLIACLGGVSPLPAAAQDPVPGPDAAPSDPAATPDPTRTPVPGDRYRIHLLTMDQGDEVWERFGHNALRIRDTETGRDLVWNWGLFNFGDVDFVPRLLRGTMLYTMGPAEFEPFLDAYRRADRTVYANEIALTPAEAGELDDFVWRNYLPENRDYVYDYYRDNCSTRVRDALDSVLGGILADAYEGAPTPHSYRTHSRRLVQETTWLDQGLSFMLGTRADRPITEWEAMFLPLEMLRLLEDFDRPDGTGPLLGPREVLYASGRSGAPDAAPSFSFVWLLLGLAAATGVGWLGRAARTREWADRGLWGVVALWGGFSGLLGLLLVLVWFTDHDIAQSNLNLFYTSPLGLLLALLAAPALVSRGWRTGTPGRVAVWLGLGIVGASVAAALAEATPWIAQGNEEVLAVAIPINLGVVWALLQRSGAGSFPGGAQQ